MLEQAWIVKYPYKKGLETELLFITAAGEVVSTSGVITMRNELLQVTPCLSCTATLRESLRSLRRAGRAMLGRQRRKTLQEEARCDRCVTVTRGIRISP